MKKVTERNESMKLSHMRKEKEIRGLKEELESVKAAAVDAANAAKKEKKELERDIRQLQRNVSLVEQQKDLLERELDTIRVNRVTAFDMSLSSGIAPANSSSPSDQRMSRFSNSVPPVHMTSASSMVSSATGRGLATAPAQLLVPAALDDSVQDLNDVISALGSDQNQAMYKEGSRVTEANTLRRSLLGSNDGGSDWQSSSSTSSNTASEVAGVTGRPSSVTERRLKALVSAAIADTGGMATSRRRDVTGPKR